MAEKKEGEKPPEDAYQLKWGQPFWPSGWPKTWVGADADITEVTDTSVKVRCRAGYWTDGSTRLGSSENFNLYLYRGWDSDPVDATTGISYYLNKRYDGSHKEVLSDHSIGMFADETVEVPRKDADYTVTLWLSGSVRGTWCDGKNGRGVKIQLRVPRTDDARYKVDWGREFQTARGGATWVGASMWPVGQDGTSATYRYRLAYWTRRKTTLGGSDSWDVSVLVGGRLLKGVGSAGDLKDPRPTSDDTAAFLEDFEFECPLDDVRRQVEVRASCRLLGQAADASNGRAPVMRATLPLVSAQRPDPPQPVTASVSRDGKSVELRWEDGSDGWAGGKWWRGVDVERSAEGGGWLLAASLGPDALAWRDTAVSPDTLYRYRLRSRNEAGPSAWSDEAEAVTAPGPVSGLSAERLGDASIRLAWTHTNRHCGFEVERRGAEGGWSSVPGDAGSAGSSVWLVDDDVPAEAVRYRVRATGEAGSSDWASTPEIAHACRPEAPTVGGVMAGAVLSAASGRAVEWTPNHPDGSPQAGAEVEVDGDVSAVDGPADSLALRPLPDGDHSVRVRTRNGMGFGPWSWPVGFTTVTPPAVALLSPADGATVTGMPLTVRWTAACPSGGATETLTVERVDGGQRWSFPVPAGGAYTVRPTDAELRDGGTYRLTVTAVDAHGFSGSASARFSVRLVAPAVPEGRFSPDAGQLCGYVWCETTGVSPSLSAVAGQAVAGAGDVDPCGAPHWASRFFPPTDHYDVWREDADGRFELVSTGVAEREMVVDPTPPLNAGYRYRVDAVSADGEVSSAWLPARVDAPGTVAVNYGPGWGRLARLRLNLSVSQDSAVSGEALDFPGVAGPASWQGAELPVWYPGPRGEGARRASGTVVDRSDAARLREASRFAGACLFRDLDGGRAEVALSASFSRQRGSLGLEDVTLEMREVLSDG